MRRKFSVRKIRCFLAALGLAFCMTFTVPASAAMKTTNGGSFKVGGVSGNWYIRCDNAGGRADIRVNAINSGVTVTLTYSYF